MQPITHLSSIIENYDALLLDLWGVVHDGSQLYPGVPEALSQLKQHHKKIIMVSNAPRRVHKAEHVLGHLGVDSECYDHVITSGELGYQWLASGRCPWGKRYFYIGPSKDADVLDGLDFKRSDDIKASDFLLNVGFGSEEEQASDFTSLLRAAKGQKLPMLCLNPDFEVVKISGERFACAGVLAADYERMGGEVKYFGKPFPEVYEHCVQLLNSSPIRGEAGRGARDERYSDSRPHPNPPPTGEGIEKKRILAIGDGIATDIAGAVGFGIDATLVTGGIIKKESPEAVEALCRKLNAVPRYVMPALQW